MENGVQTLEQLASRMPRLPWQVLVGLSGGADSVALLHLALLQGCSVHAVHVNHGLRGDASDGDEAFVRQLCSDMQVPLHGYRLVPPVHPSEDWARQERYRCFQEAAAQCGIRALALAHHQDDQAETLLLHLLRGAGLTGLTGMAPESEAQGLHILRPLLTFDRQTLRSALQQAGLCWREDDSNRDSRYLRNAIRLELLPLMERLSPGCGARLAATAQGLRLEEETLGALTEDFLKQHGQTCCLPLDALQMQQEGMQRRILRRFWVMCAGARQERNLSREQTETLMALLEGHACRGCNLPGGWHGYRGWTHLHLIPPEPLICTVALRGDVPAGCEVRTRQAGDWLQTPAGRRSLQDFLTDKKVDAPFRDRIPLVCMGSEVRCIAGIWPVGDEGSWSGEMPWVR